MLSASLCTDPGKLLFRYFGVIAVILNPFFSAAAADELGHLAPASVHNAMSKVWSWGVLTRPLSSDAYRAVSEPTAKKAGKGTGKCLST